MEDGRHLMYTAKGAHEMARAAGLAEVKDPAAYDSEHVKNGSTDSSSHGTVGAVAPDAQGALAAATSTGGTFNKVIERVGDTLLIGAGTWADESVAVSCTGVGEAFIRCAAAHDRSARMRYDERSVEQAASEVLDQVRQCGGDGGVIAVDASGGIAMPFNSQGTKRAAVSSQMPPVVSVFETTP